MRVALRRSLQHTRFTWRARGPLLLRLLVRAIICSRRTEFGLPTVCTISGYAVACGYELHILELCDRMLLLGAMGFGGGTGAQSIAGVCLHERNGDCAAIALDVSHLLLHSACVTRMCCGVGLSMWQVYHNTNSKHVLSQLQHLLRPLTTSSTNVAHLVVVTFIEHYVPAGSNTLIPRPPSHGPNNRKSGSECLHRRNVLVRMCAFVRSRQCVCISDRRRIDVGRILIVRAM